MKSIIHTAIFIHGLAFLTYAQNFIRNSVNPASSYNINSVVDVQRNTSYNQPEMLVGAGGSGFGLIQFNETNGSIVANVGAVPATSLNSMTPVKSVSLGSANDLVVGIDPTGGTRKLIIVHINTGSGIINYSLKCTPFFNNLRVIDVVYDGSTYAYILLGGVNGIGESVSLLKFNVSTQTFVGSAQPLYGLANLCMQPDDLEYVNASNIYVSGVRYDEANPTTSREFCVMRFSWTSTTATVGAPTIFTLPRTVVTNVPNRLFIRANGSSLYLAGDSYVTTAGSGPITVAKLTDSGGSSMTINWNFHYSTSKLILSGMDYKAGGAYMLLHGATALIAGGASVNWLIDVTTGFPVNASEYMPGNSHRLRSMLTSTNNCFSGSIYPTNGKLYILRTSAATTNILNAGCPVTPYLPKSVPDGLTVNSTSQSGAAYTLPILTAYPMVSFPVAPVFSLLCGNPNG